MKILVTGARGQLGAVLTAQLGGAHDVVALGHADLDISDSRAVSNRISQERPDAVVNCAAYNNVDAAEDHPLAALTLNAFAVHVLAMAAEATGAAFVHYGSDFVFDGTAARPYDENDPPKPLSVYGASKALGELLARCRTPWYVLRVESLFGHATGAAPKGTIAGLRARLLAGDVVRVFEDRVVSPSYVPDIARATSFVLEQRPQAGLYHCVNGPFCTWPELASELARALDVEPRLELVKTADVVLRAARPRYCALSNAKLARAGLALPDWRDAIRRFAHA